MTDMTFQQIVDTVGGRSSREDRLEQALRDLIAVAQSSVATPHMLASIAQDALRED